MRWLVVLGCLVVCGEASGSVILDPPIVRECPSAKTWSKIAGCLAKQGTVTIVGQYKGARLVQLTARKNSFVAGLILYVERKGEWKIGGLWRGHRSEYQLLAFEQITIGERSGYRIDIGQATPFTLVIDDVSPVAAELRTKRSLFCSGDRYHCPDATSSCEIIVRGRARFAFRGTLSVEAGEVHVKGDRSKAGQHCAVSPRVFIGWT